MIKQTVNILVSQQGKNQEAVTVWFKKADSADFRAGNGALSSETLEEDRRRVIEKVRQYYLEFRAIPPVRILARHAGISLRRFQEIFPNGFNNGFYRLAEIPESNGKYPIVSRVKNCRGKK